MPVERRGGGVSALKQQQAIAVGAGCRVIFPPLTVATLPL
jgi:hypothetical protein